MFLIVTKNRQQTKALSLVLRNRALDGQIIIPPSVTAVHKHIRYIKIKNMLNH